MIRSNIFYVVNRCSRYFINSTSIHDVVLKKIVRYLIETKDLDLRFEFSFSDQENDLIDYTDVSYENCSDIRRSTSAYVFFLNNELISWFIKRQVSVVISTAKTEYMSECHVVKKAIWISNALKSIEYEINDSVSLLTDNQTAIKLIDNSINHSRVKHIDIQYHKIRELIQESVVNISYVSIENMSADDLTKSLNIVKFQIFIELLSMIRSIAIDE